MKNLKIILTGILIAIMITILSSSVYAGTVNSVKATESEGKITVSGTVDSSVLAVAIVVYSGSDLEYMQTANVNSDGTFSVELEKVFDTGTYDVNVADYNGGAYTNNLVEVKKDGTTADNKATESKTNTTNTENVVDTTGTENVVNTTTDKTEKSKNPITGDNIAIWISLMIVSILGIALTVKFAKKNK